MKAWVTITGCVREAMCLPTPRHSGITLWRIKGHGMKVACASRVITATLSKSLRQVGFRIQMRFWTRNSKRPPRPIGIYAFEIPFCRCMFSPDSSSSWHVCESSAWLRSEATQVFNKFSHLFAHRVSCLIYGLALNPPSLTCVCCSWLRSIMLCAPTAAMFTCFAVISMQCGVTVGRPDSGDIFRGLVLLFAVLWLIIGGVFLFFFPCFVSKCTFWNRHFGRLCSFQKIYSARRFVYALLRTCFWYNGPKDAPVYHVPKPWVAQDVVKKCLLSVFTRLWWQT